MKALSKKVSVVSETNTKRTMILRLEKPQLIEDRWTMNGTGAVHIMANDDPHYVVAVLDERDKPFWSKNRGSNVLYFKSREQARELYDKTILYWQSQKAIEDLGVEAAQKWMGRRLGLGNISAKLPSNPFEF